HLQAQLRKGAASDLNSAGDKLLGEAIDVGGAKMIVGEVPAAPPEQLLAQLDRLRQKAGSSVVLVGWVDEDKAGLMCAVTDNLKDKAPAGKVLGDVARGVGGKGGGKPTMAQGGIAAPRLAEALDAARKLIQEKLGG